MLGADHTDRDSLVQSKLKLGNLAESLKTRVQVASLAKIDEAGGISILDGECLPARVDLRAGRFGHFRDPPLLDQRHLVSQGVLTEHLLLRWSGRQRSAAADGLRA